MSSASNITIYVSGDTSPLSCGLWSNMFETANLRPYGGTGSLRYVPAQLGTQATYNYMYVKDEAKANENPLYIIPTDNDKNFVLPITGNPTSSSSLPFAFSSAGLKAFNWKDDTQKWAFVGPSGEARIGGINVGQIGPSSNLNTDDLKKKITGRLVIVNEDVGKEKISGTGQLLKDSLTPSNTIVSVIGQKGHFDCTYNRSGFTTDNEMKAFETKANLAPNENKGKYTSLLQTYCETRLLTSGLCSEPSNTQQWLDTCFATGGNGEDIATTGCIEWVYNNNGLLYDPVTGDLLPQIKKYYTDKCAILYTGAGNPTPPTGIFGGPSGSRLNLCSAYPTQPMVVYYSGVTASTGNICEWFPPIKANNNNLIPGSILPGPNNKCIKAPVCSTGGSTGNPGFFFKKDNSRYPECNIFNNGERAPDGTLKNPYNPEYKNFCSAFNAALGTGIPASTGSKEQYYNYLACTSYPTDLQLEEFKKNKVPAGDRNKLSYCFKDWYTPYINASAQNLAYPALTNTCPGGPGSNPSDPSNSRGVAITAIIVIVLAVVVLLAIGVYVWYKNFKTPLLAEFEGKRGAFIGRKFGIRKQKGFTQKRELVETTNPVSYVPKPTGYETLIVAAVAKEKSIGILSREFANEADLSNAVNKYVSDPNRPEDARNRVRTAFNDLVQ